jgi:hypothetical protein
MLADLVAGLALVALIAYGVLAGADFGGGVWDALARGPELHPLQAAFTDFGGSQCGYCTPGVIMTAKALLERTPDPTKEEIKVATAGNLCRCTGYQQIVDAVEDAARVLREEGTCRSALTSSASRVAGWTDVPRSPARCASPTTCRCRAWCTRSSFARRIRMPS